MSETNSMVKPNAPRVLMGKGGYMTNEERIKKDEEEFLAMKKKALGIKDDEESTEDKPSSEEPEAEPVQAESDTEQKEEPKAEAQEDDSKLNAEEKNFKKRYGDLRRHSQKKEEEFFYKIKNRNIIPFKHRYLLISTINMKSSYVKNIYYRKVRLGTLRNINTKGIHMSSLWSFPHIVSLFWFQ